MSMVAIYDPDDGEYFGGLDIGWTKQLRLAKVYDESTAGKILTEWRTSPSDNGRSQRLQRVPIHWRVRGRSGSRVCDRGTIACCVRLLEQYGYGTHPMWNDTPYRIYRVCRKRRTTHDSTGGKGNASDP